MLKELDIFFFFFTARKGMTATIILIIRENYIKMSLGFLFIASW